MSIIIEQVGSSYTVRHGATVISEDAHLRLWAVLVFLHLVTIVSRADISHAELGASEV